jgi:uncharacterized phage protein gp47/JayE
MAFTPRQFTEILDDMISFVQANTRITDFTIGSAIRTILEASALEDDEQYFQMVQLLDIFSIRTATGVELDGRVADYNIVRLQPSTAAGKVTISDGNLISDTLAFAVNATDVTIALESTSRFPTSGFPYNVRIGEGTTSVEEVAVSANNTGTAILTVAALVNNHSIADRVSLESGGADILISAGALLQVPAVGDFAPITFTTVESGTIVNGNYNSTPISAKAIAPGILSNVGTGKITQWTSAAPFDGALVTNDTLFTGGSFIESDADLQDRALLQLQSLGKGTPLALREAVLGVADPVSGQKISTASILERFSTDEVIIYVDDGSGFVPDQVALARDAFARAPDPIPIGSGTFTLLDADAFPSEGFVLASPESAQTEVMEYTSVDYVTDVLTLNGTTSNEHDASDEVALVEVLTTSSESGVDFYNLNKYPIVRSSQRIWVGPSSSNLTLQVEGTDYYLNKARGKIEFLSPLTAGSYIAVSYTYYTGLIFQAQRFVNGSSDDDIAFPGVVAAGIEATVETPTIRRVTVRLSITANDGFEELALAPNVRTVVENYITALGIGENVIKSEIIERAMGVAGVYNVIVQQPTGDLSVAANELPVPVGATGVTLVTVN